MGKVLALGGKIGGIHAMDFWEEEKVGGGRINREGICFFGRMNEQAKQAKQELLHRKRMLLMDGWRRNIKF